LYDIKISTEKVKGRGQIVYVAADVVDHRGVVHKDRERRGRACGWVRVGELLKDVMNSDKSSIYGGGFRSFGIVVHVLSWQREKSTATDTRVNVCHRDGNNP
jgi:hypothetical protein